MQIEEYELADEYAKAGCGLAFRPLSYGRGYMSTLEGNKGIGENKNGVWDGKSAKMGPEGGYLVLTVENMEIGCGGLEESDWRGLPWCRLYDTS